MLHEHTWLYHDDHINKEIGEDNINGAWISDDINKKSETHYIWWQVITRFDFLNPLHSGLQINMFNIKK